MSVHWVAAIDSILSSDKEKTLCMSTQGMWSKPPNQRLNSWVHEKLNVRELVNPIHNELQ